MVNPAGIEALVLLPHGSKSRTSADFLGVIIRDKDKRDGVSPIKLGFKGS